MLLAGGDVSIESKVPYMQKEKSKLLKKTDSLLDSPIKRLVEMYDGNQKLRESGSISHKTSSEYIKNAAGQKE